VGHGAPLRHRVRPVDELTVENPFAELVTELADGNRWTLLRADGWDDFVERLTGLIVELAPRRRQAILLLLFALVDEKLTPEEAEAWMGAHDVDSDDGLEEMIAWLRGFRPDPSGDLPYVD
jgi:hypothetical protein